MTSVNDAPTAPTPGSFTIPEHRPFTATVGTVTSTDVDGDAIRYSIVAGNDLGGFAIDAVTGLITVADESKLDYETTPQFMLTVRATEQTAAGLFADSIVTIQLTDVPAPRVTQVRFGYGELPGRWVTPEQLAGRTAPWQIRRIEITFDADVEVNGDDLLITGVIGRDYFYSAFDYDPVTHKATWTLSSSISRDRLTLNLDGDNATSDVNRGVNTAGEHLESGDVSMSLDVLYGDVDGSGTVNLIDALFQRGRNGTDDIWADIDGSGTVNLIDALLLRGRNGTTLVGL